MPSPLDLAIALLTLLLPLAWYYRDSLPLIGGKPRVTALTNGHGHNKLKVDDGDPRDFVEKMAKSVSDDP